MKLNNFKFFGEDNNYFEFKSKNVLIYLELNNMINIAINKTKNNQQLINLENIIKNLQTYKKTIFNPSSHSDNTQVYTVELKESIKTVESFIEEIEKNKNITT